MQVVQGRFRFFVGGENHDDSKGAFEQAVGIGIGVGVGVLCIIICVTFVVYKQR